MRLVVVQRLHFGFTRTDCNNSLSLFVSLCQSVIYWEKFRITKFFITFCHNFEAIVWLVKKNIRSKVCK